MIKTPHASFFGSLMYSMVYTHPNIVHPLGVVSVFLSNPIKQHWKAVKWIVSYIKGTSNYCLCFGNTIVLEGFTDADMVEYVDTRNSTAIYV